MTKQSLYAAMVAVMDEREIDSHESDLYVKITPASIAILKLFDVVTATTFMHQTRKEQWFDIPFMFDPWWEKKVSA